MMHLACDKNLTNRKLLVCAAVAAVLLACVCFIFLPSALASNQQQPPNIVTWVDDYTSPDSINSLFAFTGGAADTINLVSKNIENALKYISYALIMSLVLIGVVKDVTNDKMTGDDLLRWFIRLAIGLSAVAFVTDIFDAITFFGQELVRSSAKYMKTDILVELAQGGGTQDSFMFWMLYVYVSIVKYALIFELAVRRAFSPLTIVSITQEGLRSAGWRYIKKCIAVYVKMAMVIALLLLAVAYINGTSNPTFVNALLIMLSAAALMGKGCSLADQVMGVA